MASIRRFEELHCWKLAREFCVGMGKIIDEKRFQHNFSLIHQIEKSSGSIMDNIAEGFERGSRKEFIVFLGYAKGSCGEARSQLYRLLDRSYITPAEFEIFLSLCQRISNTIQKLIQYLQHSPYEGIRKKQ